MIRRPPRSTRKESSAASDVYKRQDKFKGTPTYTIIAGNIKMQDGKILGDPDGTPLKFS